MPQYVSPWVGLVREAMILAVCALLVLYGKLPSEFLSGVFGTILGSRATSRGMQQMGDSLRPPPGPMGGGGGAAGSPAPANDGARLPAPPRPPMGTTPRMIAIVLCGTLAFAVVCKGLAFVHAPALAWIGALVAVAALAFAVVEHEHGALAPLHDVAHSSRRRGFVRGEALALAVILGGSTFLLRCTPAAAPERQALEQCAAEHALKGESLGAVIVACGPDAIELVIAGLLTAPDARVPASRAGREAARAEAAFSRPAAAR